MYCGQRSEERNTKNFIRKNTEKYQKEVAMNVILQIIRG